MRLARLTPAEVAVIVDLLQWREVEPEPPTAVGSALAKLEGIALSAPRGVWLSDEAPS